MIISRDIYDAMEMSGLRQSLATKGWVVIAPERLKGKPFKAKCNPPLNLLPKYDENCPFCCGNEERFPHVETLRRKDDSDHESESWAVRCVENKFKIFQDFEECPMAPTEYDRDGIYRKAMSCGHHEVVLESPFHNESFAIMSIDHVYKVVSVWHDRFRSFQSNPNNLITIVFKNHGRDAGASQAHPHSQIVGSRIVPNSIRHLIDEAQRHFDAEGVCVYCKIVQYEISVGSRLVFKNDSFVSFVPYACEIPYEIHIVPLCHQAIWTECGENELRMFSECLQRSCKALYLALSNTDFNILVMNPPYHHRHSNFWHWHVKILPITGRKAGFELSTNIGVSVVSPEDASAHLRELKPASDCPCLEKE